jgi:hypothetical protein
VKPLLIAILLIASKQEVAKDERVETRVDRSKRNDISSLAQ